MIEDWDKLTALTRGNDLVIERVRLKESEIAIEGSFALPPLAQLSAEDQVFVAAFVRSHGSIKQMERLFGVSYPTIKSRLRQISERLRFVAVAAEPPEDDTLDRLERGEISAEEAIRLLRGEQE
jgi:hypothetical protein